MNEVASVLKQTNRERKVAGYGVHHKKGGSAVSKLGNKPLSWKEIADRHGKCESFDMTGFPTFEEFEKFPVDLKVEYVNKLMDKYDIELQHISLYLFNKGADGLKSHLRNQRMENDRALKFCDYQKSRAKTGLLKFQADVEDWKRREKAAKEIDEAEAQRKRDIIWNAEFITHDEFKQLPVDGQIAYVNNMIKKYNVSIGAISKILFELPKNSLRDYFNGRKVMKSIDVQSSPKGYRAEISNRKFQDLVDEWRGVSVAKEEVVENEPEAVLESELSELIMENGSDDPSDTVEKFMESIPELPTINLEFDASKIDNPVYGTSFATTYISEKGLDQDKLYLLAALFENEENLEVSISIRTRA